MLQSVGYKESDTTGQLNNNMNYLTLATLQGFRGGTAVKNASANTRDTRDMGLIPGLGIPWSRKWQPTPVFLPGESPWRKKSGRLQSMELQKVQHD